MVLLQHQLSYLDLHVINGIKVGSNKKLKNVFVKALLVVKLFLKLGQVFRKNLHSTIISEITQQKVVYSVLVQWTMVMVSLLDG
jgi:hypothetical protein